MHDFKTGHLTVIVGHVHHAFAIAANVLRDLLTKKVSKWIPLPMALAVSTFLVGVYFAIDMCVGSLIVWVSLAEVGQQIERRG
ncbi:Metal-nicotianamine transporter YSL3 [Linum perenne]